MQVQNPQYKFYKKLAGTWKSNDFACTVILDVYAHIEITYGNAKLDSSYSVLETNALYETNSMAMMGFMFSSQVYKRHPGEELKVQMNNASLSDGSHDLFTVNCLWYDGEKFNIELMDSFDGKITALILTREGTELAPDQTGYVCECGYSGPFGNFCPNCGRKVEKEYTCQCGYRSKGAKFCPNCGQPTGQFISSNPTREADTKPEPTVPSNPEDVLISISTYMSTNPPVNTYTRVYKYSDTQLLLDCNGQHRLISANVLEPAMEIIRKNRLDDPDFKDPSAMGIMGGSVYIGFKDGDRLVQTSLQTQGFAVTNAQNELMGLFNRG